MSNIGLIPARIGSKRLLNKPLEMIEGYPMYFHVYKRAQLSNLDKVYLCTDSKKIFKQAKDFNIPTIFTSSKHKNGSERCGEAAKKLKIKKNDVIVNIHSDEPLLDPVVVNTVIKFFESNNFDIVFPHLIINKPEKNNINSVKIVTNHKNKVLYMSRSLIPSNYTNLTKIKKQCGITAFSKDILDLYNSLSMSINEKIEKIELLRAIDNDLNIGTVLVDKPSMSVDTNKDLIKVKKIIKKDKILNKYL